MKFVEVATQKEWDGFVSSLSYAQFTQSWAWGEFQKSLGKNVKRFFVIPAKAGIHPAAAVQLIHQPRRMVGGYWLAPRGPVGTVNERVMKFLAQELPAHLGRSLFIRLEPLIPSEGRITIRPYVSRRSYNPATTILNNLTKSEEELLAAMHPKTRYNIHVAEKRGVTVREGGEKDLKTFLALAAETAKRDRFLQLDLKYLAATYRSLSKQGIARLRLAEHEGKVLAANMEMSYGDTVTYLHGTSSSESRNVMAPFALHWEAMVAARNAGKHTYDWWGCNPENAKDPNYKKSWEGITRFKMGWGGKRVAFTGTRDLPRNRTLYALAFPRTFFRR